MLGRHLIKQFVEFAEPKSILLVANVFVVGMLLSGDFSLACSWTMFLDTIQERKPQQDPDQQTRPY